MIYIVPNVLLSIKEALIKSKAIVSDARKTVTENVEKRFNQPFINEQT